MNWSRQRKSYALYHQENEVRKSPKLSNSLRGKKKFGMKTKLIISSYSTSKSKAKPSPKSFFQIEAFPSLDTWI